MQALFAPLRAFLFCFNFVFGKGWIPPLLVRSKVALEDVTPFALRCKPRLNLIPFLLVTWVAMGNAAHAEPPLRFYFTGTYDYTDIEVASRSAACPLLPPIWNKPPSIIFSNPRLGDWYNAGGRYAFQWWPFTCVYDSYINGAVDNNDARGVGRASCGAGNWYVDIPAERCVCPTATTVNGTCQASCPADQILIGKVCHGGKNNGNQCPSTPNPIAIGSGNKFLQELILKGVMGLDLQLRYNYNDDQISQFGRRWRSTFDRQLLLESASSIITFRHDGRAFRFTSQSAGWISEVDVNHTLKQLHDSTGALVGWQLKIAADDSVETYDPSGKMTSIQFPNGFPIQLTYSDGTVGPNGDVYLNNDSSPSTMPIIAGQLIKASDPSGRALRFRYGWLDRVAQAVDPSGQIYALSYDSRKSLTGITFPDGKTRQYLYNEPAYTSGTDLPHALTGIIDENGARYGTYTYDTQGRAISSEHATGGIDKHSLVYNSGNTVVTNPLGSQHTYNFKTI